MKQRQIDIQFPIKGLNRKVAYRQQPPYSTPDCLNVRALETIASRVRGGSRPGLVLSHVDCLGAQVDCLTSMTLALGNGFTNFSDTFGGLVMSSAWSIAPWATSMPAVMTDVPAAAIDTSVYSGDATLATLPIKASDPYTVEMYIVPWSGYFCGAYRLYLRLDSTPAIGTNGVMVEITMTDNTGAYIGTVQAVSAGVSSTIGTFSGTTGTSQPGWLSATVSGDNIMVFWCGVQVLTTTPMGTQAGLGVGFGMTCTVNTVTNSNIGGACLINVFRVQYYSTGDVNALRSVLVGIAGGDLWYEYIYGRMTELSSSLTFLAGMPLTATQDGQKLYVADYGQVIIPKGSITGLQGSVSGLTLTDATVADFTALGIVPLDMVVVLSDPQGTAVADTFQIASIASGAITLVMSSAQTTLYGAGGAGVGAVAYRIERAPKVYDPLSNTISILTADLNTTGTTPFLNGQVPTGCPLICRYLDRIVLAGAASAPQVWYMAHVSDPQNWDYTALSNGDTQSAVAGTASAAGVPGEPITALVPHSDDYLVIGCRNSLWKMSGDPAAGGALVNLSHAVGIIGPKAWCLCPDGSLVFLSMDGLYVMDAAGNAFPTSISRENMPREFAHLDPDMLTVSMEYDISGCGIHIFLTPTYAAQSTHWWLDTGLDTSQSYGILSTVSRRTYWPLTLVDDHEPTATSTLLATAIEDSGVIVGGRDGYLRKFCDLADTDCGTAFDSYVVMGPIALAKDVAVGTMLAMDATLAEESGYVTWSLTPSLSFEGACSAPASSSGTWGQGVNATVHPAARGQAASLVLTGQGFKWAVEQISGIIKEGGTRRIQ